MSSVTARNKRIGPALGTTAFTSTAATVAAFLGAATLILGVLFVETNHLLTDQVLGTLRAEAAVLEREAQAGGIDALAKSIAARAQPDGPGLYHLSDAAGRNRAGNLDHVPPEFKAGGEGGVFRYAKRTDGTSGERLAVALVVGVPGGRLIVGRDIEEQRAFAERMRRVFLLGFGALSLAALAAALVTSRLVLRRIEAINAASRSIMAGELSRRVPLRGSGDELDSLAQNLNAMLDRIEQLMSGLREVSDNIAHDLKTPLNRLRNRVEAALRDPRGALGYREGLEHALEGADDLIKTFNALLLIARLEAGAFEDSTERFDLSEVLRDFAEFYGPLAEENGLELVMEAHEGVVLAANRQLIGQAVANLIENAIKYSRTNGRIATAGTETMALRGRTITIELRRAETTVEISVADRGPGINLADRERALKRFVRLEESRTEPGSGLGLSLVAAVARLHGGRVRLEDNRPGLRAVLELPARLIVG